MNYKKIVKQIISEIIHDQMKPTMKYYAFDWGDNLMYMPTKIYLIDDKGKSVGIESIRGITNKIQYCYYKYRDKKFGQRLESLDVIGDFANVPDVFKIKR